MKLDFEGISASFRPYLLGYMTLCFPSLVPELIDSPSSLIESLFLLIMTMQKQDQAMFDKRYSFLIVAVWKVKASDSPVPGLKKDCLL